MTPRLRRLQADHQRVWEIFTQHPSIRLIDAQGSPAERYVFEFHLPALTQAGDGAITTGAVHRGEVFLPLDYPRRAPVCRMLTPVFHPNIDPAKICIGDHWSAGQSLAHLVARIGEMLCYQSYNTRSPLNAEAAAWAELNAARLPLSAEDLGAGL